MRDRVVTAPRLVPTEPPPDAAQPPAWCRALGTHDWEIVPPMLIMPGSTVRVTLHCGRCGSMRADRWKERSGDVDSRQYRYTEAYVSLLEDTRSAARKGVLHDGKPQPLSTYVRTLQKETTSGKNGSPLRLVSSRKSVRRRKS